MPEVPETVLTGEVADRLESLIEEKADELGMDVIELAIHPNHVHLFIRGYPKLAPNKINQQLKGYSSRVLRGEYDFGFPTLWTLSYFVSSEDEVSSRLIEEQTGQKQISRSPKVDEACTSRSCNRCVEQEKRDSQGLFACPHCGLEDYAEEQGLNIAKRALGQLERPLSSAGALLAQPITSRVESGELLPVVASTPSGGNPTTSVMGGVRKRRI